jgi:hypothetical protein
VRDSRVAANTSAISCVCKSVADFAGNLAIHADRAAGFFDAATEASRRA